MILIVLGDAIGANAEAGGLNISKLCMNGDCQEATQVISRSSVASSFSDVTVSMSVENISFNVDQVNAQGLVVYSNQTKDVSVDLTNSMSRTIESSYLISSSK